MKFELFIMYFCTVKNMPKMFMNTVLFHLFIPAKVISYAFGFYFCIWVLFTPILKHLILLAKQAFVCKTLIITPPLNNKKMLVGCGRF